jgi:hypothetical protein
MNDLEALAEKISYEADYDHRYWNSASINAIFDRRAEEATYSRLGSIETCMETFTTDRLRAPPKFAAVEELILHSNARSLFHRVCLPQHSSVADAFRSPPPVSRAYIRAREEIVSTERMKLLRWTWEPEENAAQWHMITGRQPLQHGYRPISSLVREHAIAQTIAGDAADVREDYAPSEELSALVLKARARVAEFFSQLYSNEDQIAELSVPTSEEEAGATLLEALDSIFGAIGHSKFPEDRKYVSLSEDGVFTSGTQIDFASRLPMRPTDTAEVLSRTYAELHAHLSSGGRYDRDWGQIRLIDKELALFQDPNATRKIQKQLIDVFGTTSTERRPGPKPI